MLDGSLARTWPYVSLFLSLVFLSSLPHVSTGNLGKRELNVLPASAIASLVETPDPVRNVDPANPSSHLSRILIPRPPAYSDMQAEL